MRDTCNQNGRLILVVGPSGCGKDTLLNGAAKALLGNLKFVFIQREITRPSFVGGEKHIAISQKEFDIKQRNQEYVLWWSANGLSYGVGKTLDRSLNEGKKVILNGSRAATPMVKKRYPKVKIIQVVVSKDILRKRLEQRGRESSEEIEARLARGEALKLKGNKIYNFNNDQPLDTSLKSFVSLLTGIK